MEIRPAYYTVKEVSQLLRIGRRKTYDLIESGDIPSIRLGSSIRIPRLKFEQQFDIANTPTVVYDSQ